MMHALLLPFLLRLFTLYQYGAYEAAAAFTTTTEETFTSEIERNVLPVWLTAMQTWMVREMESTRRLPHEVAGMVIMFFDALPAREKQPWINTYQQCVNRAAQVCNLDFLQHDVRLTEGCGKLDACARLLWKLEDCEERLIAERSPDVPFFTGDCKVLWDLQRKSVDYLETLRRLRPLSLAQMTVLLDITARNGTLTAENTMFMLGEMSANKNYLAEISRALKRFHALSPLAQNKILVEQFVMPISELITSNKYKAENCLNELRRISGNDTIERIARLRKEGRTAELRAMILEYGAALQKELRYHQMDPIKVFEMHGGCKPLWFEYAGKETPEAWLQWLTDDQRAELREQVDLHVHREIRGWYFVHEFLRETFERRSQYDKKTLLPLYNLI